MEPVARVSGPEVRLQWKEPPAPVELTYQVIRSRRLGSSTERVIGIPDGAAVLDRPGPGVWWYRVAITPGARPGGWPPSVVVAFSPPIRVFVRAPNRLPIE